MLFSRWRVTSSEMEKLKAIVPKSIDIDRIVILSPFVKESFVKKLMEYYQPNNVLVICDKVNELESDNISQLENVEVKLSECKGIVHSKLFLFKSSEKNIFLWGSCNATDAAFGQNTETYAWVKFPSSERKELLDYFNQLSKDAPIKIEEFHCSLNGIQVFLPEFSLIEPKNNFDKWLENGVLFNPESNTIPKTLKVELKRDIKATNQDGIKVHEKKTVDIELFGEKNAILPKNLVYKNYAAETIYGHWIHKDIRNSSIFIEIEKEFGKKIDDLINYVEKEKEKLINSGYERLEKFVKESLGDKLDRYFDKPAIKGGQLNSDYFKKDFREQLERHIQKYKILRKEPFQHYPIPSIRPNKEQWNRFVKSFVEFIRQKIEQKRIHNNLSKIIRDYTKPSQDGLFTEIEIMWDEATDEIIQQLRYQEWQGKVINDNLIKKLKKTKETSKNSTKPGSSQRRVDKR